MLIPFEIKEEQDWLIFWGKAYKQNISSIKEYKISLTFKDHNFSPYINQSDSGVLMCSSGILLCSRCKMESVVVLSTNNGVQSIVNLQVSEPYGGLIEIQSCDEALMDRALK